MDESPSIGEAHRRIDRVEARLDGRVVSLNVYQAEQQATRAAIANLKNELERRIDDVEADKNELKERLTWAWRIAITGIIFPVVATIIGALALTTILGGR